MKELVSYIAKAVVSKPDEVEVFEVNRSSDSIIVELHVAPDDRGKIIGKKGRTAHAIRTLLTAAGPEGQTYTLDIVD
ncbi:MAG: KH domain-containing protein [Deltaproteobacteria bacterium]|nr:KH domain-containing protein [Deltaproteobacteria bacterium]